MTQAARVTPARRGLAHLPVALLTAGMGLFGLATVWRNAETVLGAPASASEAILWATSLAYAVLVLAFVAKLARHPQAVRVEFEDPIRVCFFSAAGISLMLAAPLYERVWAVAAEPMWLVGYFVYLGLALVIVRRWIAGAHDFRRLAPVWFIPVAAGALAPTYGLALGHVGLAWLMFATAVLFWLLLMVLLMNRLIFHDPLPAPLRPSLFIPIVPPALAYVSLVAIQDGREGPVALFFLYVSAFMAILAVSLLPSLWRLRFSLGWWAYAFSLDALANAVLVHASLGADPHWAIIAAALVAISTVVVALVLWLSLRSAWTGSMFEHG